MTAEDLPSDTYEGLHPEEVAALTVQRVRWEE